MTFVDAVSTRVTQITCSEDFRMSECEQHSKQAFFIELQPDTSNHDRNEDSFHAHIRARVPPTL